MWRQAAQNLPSFLGLSHQEEAMQYCRLENSVVVDILFAYVRLWTLVLVKLSWFALSNIADQAALRMILFASSCFWQVLKVLLFLEYIFY